MGNNVESLQNNANKQQINIIQKLQPYDEIITEQFGPVKIFRINQKISRYYMQYREIGVLVDKTKQRFEEKMMRYKQFKEHRNIVAIEGIQLVETNQMCVKKIYLEIYARYYNFSLQMALDLKRQKQIRFRDGDLFYIFSCLLSIAKETNQIFKDAYSGWFTLNNIFIAPEGLIKLYIFPLKEYSIQQRSSHKYSRSYLENQECIVNNPLKVSISRQNNQSPPKEVSSPKKVKKTRRNDIRDIGLLLFKLIMIQKQPQNLQSESFESLEDKLYQFSMEQSLNKRLKQLILLLLKRYDDLTLNEIENLYQSFKNNEQEDERIYVANSIKLQQGVKLQKSNTNSKLSINEKLRSSKAIHLTIGSKDKNSFIKK